MAEEKKVAPAADVPTLTVSSPAKHDKDEKKPSPPTGLSHAATVKARSGPHFGMLSVTVNKPGAIHRWNEQRIKGLAPSGRSHCVACVYHDTYVAHV